MASQIHRVSPGTPVYKSVLLLTDVLATRKISTWNIFIEDVKDSVWPILSKRGQKMGDCS